MIDSFHYTVYGSYGRGLPRDLDGYVHLTASAWLAAPVDTAGEPMTPEQAEELAERSRAELRYAEAAVLRAAASTPLTAQEVRWINEGASQQMRGE
jgi:hypothetical protein